MTRDTRQDGVYITQETDLVASEVEAFKQVLLDAVKAGAINLSIDMKQVEMIDSSGIGVLIAARNSIQKKDGTVTITNLSANILKMFKMMRMDAYFNLSGRGE